MPKSRGGRRPGAGRPALPMEVLKRKDLAGHRKLKHARPMLDLHSVLTGAVVSTVDSSSVEAGFEGVTNPPPKSGSRRLAKTGPKPNRQKRTCL